MTRARTARGLSESVQWAVLTPLLLFLILGLIQGGLWLHGRTVASNAAIAAAEEAALIDGTSADARAIAERIAAQGGLQGVDVRIVQSAERASATVSGTMPTFVDLGQTRVSEQSTRPRERVTRP